jgi:hypothetical protein
MLSNGVTFRFQVECDVAAFDDIEFLSRLAALLGVERTALGAVLNVADAPNTLEIDVDCTPHPASEGACTAALEQPLKNLSAALGSRILRPPTTLAQSSQTVIAKSIADAEAAKAELLQMPLHKLMKEEARYASEAAAAEGDGAMSPMDQRASKAHADALAEAARTMTRVETWLAGLKAQEQSQAEMSESPSPATPTSAPPVDADLLPVSCDQKPPSEEASAACPVVDALVHTQSSSTRASTATWQANSQATGSRKLRKSLIGLTLRIYWPSDRTWHTGVVTRHDVNCGWRVTYDSDNESGLQRWHGLIGEEWEVME